MHLRIASAVLLAIGVVAMASPGCDHLFEPPTARSSRQQPDAEARDGAATDAPKQREANRAPFRSDEAASRADGEDDARSAKDSSEKRDAPMAPASDAPAAPVSDAPVAPVSDAPAAPALDGMTAEAVMAIFHDPQASPARRAAAAVELGERHDWDAMPRLIRALNDHSREVRVGAKRAIETIIGVGFAPPGPNSRGPLVYGVDMPAADREAFVGRFKKYYPRFKAAHEKFMRDRERFGGQ